MSSSVENDWLCDVYAGDLLIVYRPLPLYPQSMWYKPADDESTWIIDLPMLSVSDKCIVLDVLKIDHDSDDSRVGAALVATRFGVGCMILESSYVFKKNL